MRQQTLRDKLLGYPAPVPEIPKPLATDNIDGWYKIKTFFLLDRVFEIQIKQIKMSDVMTLSTPTLETYNDLGYFAYDFDVIGFGDNYRLRTRVMGSMVRTYDVIDAGAPRVCQSVIYQIGSMAISEDETISAYCKREGIKSAQQYNRDALEQGKNYQRFWRMLKVGGLEMLGALDALQKEQS